MNILMIFILCFIALFLFSFFQSPYNTLQYIIVGDSTAQSYFRGVKQGANQEYDLQLIRSPADNPNIKTFTVSLLFILLYSFITVCIYNLIMQFFSV
jgi:hypothetical protein